MRCPKCQYITFNSGGRCRNCGYEFSLAVEDQVIDLPIQTGDEAIGPLGDLSLSSVDDAMASPSPLHGSPPAWVEPSPPPAPPRAGPRHASPSAELPLFKDRTTEDDAPLVTLPAVPRPPVSVRRSGPVMARSQRAVAEEPELDLEMPDDERRIPIVRRVVAASAAAQETAASPGAPAVAAGAFARLTAVVVDALLLGAIDAGVLYFTLQLCGLQVAEIGVLPPVPLVGFLLLLNGGYFVTFTAAGGQTIGKMLTRIKVVPADTGTETSDRVPFGHAVLRAAAYGVSLLPAGLGFLPALVGHERRAIHDRLADTRVVKA
jgi:uncharacterized RDD family membrane protein YckC